MKQVIDLRVNGELHQVAVEPQSLLLSVLRDQLDLLGTKGNCHIGNCGACTVIIDGKAALSCLTLAIAAQGKEITTIEGLAEGDTLHPIQKAFIEKGAVQCGFCTPGMILSAKALLDKNPGPSRKEVAEALSGNLCRCTGYQKPIDAVLAASQSTGTEED